MPALQERCSTIPQAELENLPELLALFDDYRHRAMQNPGAWQRGNLVLGAPERDYRPSEPELIASVIGERIRRIVQQHPPEIVSKARRESGFTEGLLRYRLFHFTHTDVMGSGRFFYVDRVEDKVMILP
jgi:hypothetical protein